MTPPTALLPRKSEPQPKFPVMGEPLQKSVSSDVAALQLRSMSEEQDLRSSDVLAIDDEAHEDSACLFDHCVFVCWGSVLRYVLLC